MFVLSFLFDYFGTIVKLLQIIDFYFLGCASQVATGGLVWLVDAWMSDWPGGSDWKFAGRFGLEVCSLDDAGDSFRILGEILSFLDL